jgi:hypothetical protein
MPHIAMVLEKHPEKEKEKSLGEDTKASFC